MSVLLICDKTPAAFDEAGAGLCREHVTWLHSISFHAFRLPTLSDMQVGLLTCSLLTGHGQEQAY